MAGCGRAGRLSPVRLGQLRQGAAGGLGGVEGLTGARADARDPRGAGARQTLRAVWASCAPLESRLCRGWYQRMHRGRAQGGACLRVELLAADV